MTDFWSDRRVLVTGGSGLPRPGGRRPARRPGAPASVIVPRERRVRPPATGRRGHRLFADVQPDLVIHLAARVGGIGANQARPADLYLDNLLMGTYVLDEARRRETRRRR